MNRQHEDARKSEAQQRLDSLTQTALLFERAGRGVPSAVIDEAGITVRFGANLDSTKASPAFCSAVWLSAEMIRGRAEGKKISRETRRSLAVKRERGVHGA